MASENQGRFAKFIRGYGRLTIFMIPIGIAINFVGGQIAILLKLPLYLDSIGTILVGALCGGIPGALTGFLGNCINSISSPTTFAYGIISILLGLTAGFFSRRRVFLSWWKTIVSALVYSVWGGIGGAIITIWLFGGLGTSGSSLIAAILIANHVSIASANFIAGYPVDLIDKIPTVFIVYLILLRLPTRLLTKLPLGSIYLRKTSAETAAPAQIGDVEDFDDDDDNGFGSTSPTGSTSAR